METLIKVDRVSTRAAYLSQSVAITERAWHTLISCPDQANKYSGTSSEMLLRALLLRVESAIRNDNDSCRMACASTSGITQYNVTVRHDELSQDDNETIVIDVN